MTAPTGKSGQFRAWLEDELRRRLLHRMWTEKPYDECPCSTGGACPMPVLSGPPTGSDER